MSFRHPPSPTALTPRRCFNNTNTSNIKPRAWDRQPRAASGADGKSRTIWKRWESGAEQEKENVVPEEVEACVGEQEETIMSPKKAIKKMCLGGGEVEVKSWERRGSGLMHKVPQLMADVPVLEATSTTTADEPVLGELDVSMAAEEEASQAHAQNETASLPDTDHKGLAQVSMPEAPMDEQQASTDEHQVADMSTEKQTIAAMINNNEEDLQLPNLVPMQVWSRSSIGLRDDTISARAACSTPKRKSPTPKPCLSPATQLDQITPSFLKKMFSVLNESMASTPRSFAATTVQQSMESPTKTMKQVTLAANIEMTDLNTVSSEESEDGLIKLESDVPHLQGADSTGAQLPQLIGGDEQDEQDTIPHAAEDDTQMLLDFLSRTEAKKAKRAASIAKRSSLSHRRDSGAVRGALASPQKPLHAPEAEALMSPEKIVAVVDCSVEAPIGQDKQSVPIGPIDGAVITNSGEETLVAASADVKTNRRSTRIPKQTKIFTPETPNAITIFRTDGQELRVLKDAEARALATTTRSNTRRNKGGAVNVPEMLKKLKKASTEAGLISDVDEKQSAVRWKDDIAQYCEIAAREEQTSASFDQAADATETEKTQEAARTTIPRARRPARPAVKKIKTAPEAPMQPSTSEIPSGTDAEATCSAAAPVLNETNAVPKAVAAARTLRLPQPVRGRGANISKQASGDAIGVMSTTDATATTRSDIEGPQIRRPATRRVRSR